MPIPVIRSQAISIGELLRLGSFRPARVQRDYCWKENQQAALLQDLISAFGEFGLDPDADPDADPESFDVGTGARFQLADYNRELEATEPYVFVGTVVLHNAGQHFDIYDGLQRLTTFTVIFAVLRDMIEAERKHPVNALLVNEAGISRLNLGMKHNTLEADILAPGRTAKRHRPHPQLTEASYCLRTCVNTARAMLRGWPTRRLEAFTSFIAEGAIVNVTRISDRRMAAKAFVSINSGGLPLKPEEIVKGQLIDLTSSLPDADDQAKRVLNVWNGIQDDLGPEAFDDFLRSVDFIERRMPQSSDFSIQLMEHIRRQYQGQAGVRWATDVLLQYRSAFKWIHEENNAEIADGVHASLRRLQLLKWDQWRAYAMLLKMKSNPADLPHRIDTLDRICFALTVSTPDPRRGARSRRQGGPAHRALEGRVPRSARRLRSGGVGAPSPAAARLQGRPASEGPRAPDGARPAARPRRRSGGAPRRRPRSGCGGRERATAARRWPPHAARRPGQALPGARGLADQRLPPRQPRQPAPRRPRPRLPRERGR